MRIVGMSNSYPGEQGEARASTLQKPAEGDESQWATGVG